MLNRIPRYHHYYELTGKVFRSHSRTIITRVKELELSNLPPEKKDISSPQSPNRNVVIEGQSSSEPTSKSEPHEMVNKNSLGLTTDVPPRTLTPTAAAAPPITITTTTPSIPEKFVYRRETAYITGIPPEQARRTVRIYPSSKTAMQSGTFGTRFWKLRFEPQETWENPLMGWTASADPLQATQLEFNTKEDAIRFAEKNGWKCNVSEQQRPISRPKSYSANFRYEPRKLRLIQTK
jgi:NADH dehydrogenase (ubiquinone) Fe-S protein 4